MKKIISAFIFLFMIQMICKAQKNDLSESFEEFQNKFIIDSIFQHSRLMPDIIGRYETIDTSFNFTRKDWPLITQSYFDPDTSTYTVIKFRHQDEYLFSFYCKDCGYYEEIAFKLIDSNWYVEYRTIGDH